jgi:hypothetical protein
MMKINTGHCNLSDPRQRNTRDIVYTLVDLSYKEGISPNTPPFHHKSNRKEDKLQRTSLTYACSFKDRATIIKPVEGPPYAQLYEIQR